MYYLKNIDYLKIDNSNFNLNDNEFEEIKNLSINISSKTIILFWQFTIRTLHELDIVSNQNLSIKMFLIRLTYLVGLKEANLKLDLNDDKANLKQKVKVLLKIFKR